MSNRVKRFFVGIAGMPQSGKTFYSNQTCNAYSKCRGGVLAYNCGKPEDWQGYEVIEPLTMEDHLRLFYKSKRAASQFQKYPKMEYYRYNGKIFHFKYFCRMFYKKRVKMYRIPSRQMESAFFKTIFYYFSNMLVVFDDAKPLFRSGLNEGHIQVFSRVNHCGTQIDESSFFSKGIDVITIFHNLDKISEELYDYYTRINMFRCTSLPRPQKMGNDELYQSIKSGYTYLKNAPPYHYCEIPLEGRDSYKLIKQQPLILSNA